MFNHKIVNAVKNLLVLGFFFGLLYIIVYKALRLPVTYDEVSAALNYPRFNIWQIIMFTDNWPSNHILNTLFIKLSEYIFGITPLSIRLPNIIAFILFFSALYLIARKYFSRLGILFFMPFILCLSNPYFLDFFSLARGYGLSNTLMLISVFFLLKFMDTGINRYYFLVILFSMLAAYANFTLLIFWVAVHVPLLVLAYIRFENEKDKAHFAGTLAVTLLISVLFLLLCYIPLHKMQSTNQFQYWAHKSFYQNTIVETIFDSRAYHDNILFKNTTIANFFVVFSIFMAMCTLFKCAISRRISFLNKSYTSMLTMLLFSVFTVNIMQSILLGTPYLNGRTALSYYVLFCLVFMFWLRDTGKFNIVLANVLALVTTVLLLMNLYLSIELNRTIEWWFDVHTYHVVNYIKKHQQECKPAKVVTLNTHWEFYPSFSFYKQTGKINNIEITPQHVEADTNSTTLFYYTFYSEVGMLKRYKPVLCFEDGMCLLQLKNE